MLIFLSQILNIDPHLKPKCAYATSCNTEPELGQNSEFSLIGGRGVTMTGL